MYAENTEFGQMMSQFVLLTLGKEFESLAAICLL